MSLKKTQAHGIFSPPLNNPQRLIHACLRRHSRILMEYPGEAWQLKLKQENGCVILLNLWRNGRRTGTLYFTVLSAFPLWS